MDKSFWALCAGAVLVLMLTAGVWLASWHRAKRLPDSSNVLREPLGIPRGSVRSMLGLLIVGGFVDLLLFGWPAFKSKPEIFTTVVSTFATLTGTVTGFYFGHRAAQGASPPETSTPISASPRAGGDDDAHQDATGGAQQNQQ